MTAPPGRLAAALADRYRVDRELGQGGMATVYLAEDLRHVRPVAIKVLRPELASALGGDRFLAEIRTTARLQHPNILPLHDSGAVGELLFYVMPYVEGESLRDCLEREGQLPVDDAIRIAGEVASALDYAHRKGIIHRDIKPENILLHEGRAMVADFGIALAASRAGADRMTGTGLSLGTPRYMSPEQAMGERQITARSDIYALGCVVYEMLLGTPPFTGPTAQAVVARALSETPPPIRTARPSVPAAVERAVFKALERVPADRWRSAAEFAVALERRSGALDEPVTAAPARATAHRFRLVTLSGVAVLSALGVLGVWGAKRFDAPAPGAVARLVVPLDSGQALAPDALPFAIAADGSAIVYVGESGGRRQLYLRPLASFEARAIPGTDGAHQPFFSPDGRWVAFVADGRLQKVPREGGAPITITQVRAIWGADWSRDGTILYAVRGPALYRVADRGGVATEVPVDFHPDSAVLNVDPAPVRWPRLLPGARHAIVSAGDDVAIVTLATGEIHTLFPGRQAHYLATGHLVYDEGEGRIRVVPFDLDRLAVTGDPEPAFEAFRSPGLLTSQFTVSENGTVVYVAGGFARSLVLSDAAGRLTPLALQPRGYRFPRFAPDGQRIIVTVDPRPSETWLVDLRRESAVPVVRGPHTILPFWSPDGSRIGYWGAGIHALRWPSADSAVRLFPPLDRANFWPADWSARRGIVGDLADTLGRRLAYFALGDSALTMLSPAGENAWGPDLSPDGGWLAYVSDVSGVAEVYARPFDGAAEALLISIGGGSDPHWTADGTAIIYRNGTSIMRAELRRSTRLEPAARPRELFSAPFDFSQAHNWDVDASGRFVFVRSDPATVGRLMVVTGWFGELER
jgi:Tol biopolymer transport system component/tRNA A-37 threonylcarbamoyl transferase component Bud32